MVEIWKKGELSSEKQFSSILTVTMTSAQVVETSVYNSSCSQELGHQGDQITWSCFLILMTEEATFHFIHRESLNEWNDEWFNF